MTGVFAGVPKAGDGKRRLLGFLKQMSEEAFEADF